MAYSDRQSTDFNVFNEPKSRCLWVKDGSINKAVRRVYIKSNGVLKHVRRIMTKSSLTSASGSAGSEGALTDPLKTVYPQRTMHLVLNNGISTFQKDYNDSGNQHMALSFGLSCQQQFAAPTPNLLLSGYGGFNSGGTGPYGRGDRIYFPIGWTGKISYWVSGIARGVTSASQGVAQGSEIGTTPMRIGWNAAGLGSNSSVVYVNHESGVGPSSGGAYYSPDNADAAYRMPLLSPSQAHANTPNYRWWEFDRGSDGFSMFQLITTNAPSSALTTALYSTMWVRDPNWGAPTGIPANTALGTQLTRFHRENEAALYPVRYGLLNHGAPDEGQLSNIVSNSTHLVPNYTDEGDEGYNFPNHYYYPPLTSPWIGMMIRWDGSYGDDSKIRINPAWGTNYLGDYGRQNRWVDAPGVALHMAVTTLGDIQPVFYAFSQERTDLVNDQLNLFPRRVGAAATINSPASDVPY